MAVKLSKNAKKNGPDVFYCQCGGEVRMISVYNRGKLQTQARCKRCNRVARFPRELA